MLNGLHLLGSLFIDKLHLFIEFLQKFIDIMI